METVTGVEQVQYQMSFGHCMSNQIYRPKNVRTRIIVSLLVDVYSYRAMIHVPFCVWSRSISFFFLVAFCRNLCFGRTVLRSNSANVDLKIP